MRTTKTDQTDLSLCWAHVTRYVFSLWDSRDLSHRAWWSFYIRIKVLNSLLGFCILYFCEADKVFILIKKNVVRAAREKMYFRSFAPSEDWISLLTCAVCTVFAESALDLQECKASLEKQWRLIRLRGCAGWSESSLGAHVWKYLFSRSGS